MIPPRLCRRTYSWALRSNFLERAFSRLSVWPHTSRGDALASQSLFAAFTSIHLTIFPSSGSGALLVAIAAIAWGELTTQVTHLELPPAAPPYHLELFLVSSLHSTLPAKSLAIGSLVAPGTSSATPDLCSLVGPYSLLLASVPVPQSHNVQEGGASYIHETQPQNGIQHRTGYLVDGVGSFDRSSPASPQLTLSHHAAAETVTDTETLITRPLHAPRTNSTPPKTHSPTNHSEKESIGVTVDTTRASLNKVSGIL